VAVLLLVGELFPKRKVPAKLSQAIRKLEILLCDLLNSTGRKVGD
jgi:hypothetical protein